MPFVPPKTEKCVRCGKSVYANERMEAGDKIWHRLCFRCSVCDMSLKSEEDIELTGWLAND
ncbi:hypothetical protein CRM22_010787 [Opisthorchis felineus]|uniref:LIM zinc-binding domain-containing protein n=1 Tax=Opisthorchis felineus TaxID=147828 RepID=A0A4S2KR39_OPIFE|nr:hypothetical protein CRM22_010787 [Opisthorchis felineus]